MAEGRLLDGRTRVPDVRDPGLHDLLGRRPTEIDLAPIAAFLRGKRVLVTGAGGSIGSELCRQIRRFGPAELTMLDRDESALHAVQLSLQGRALLDGPELVLADLRDAAAIRAAFRAARPQIVFHAAALKHLPLLQRHPGEAVQTNVWGTQTVLEQAQETGVETFVNISTDKAASPIGVLGYSKRITERLTAYAASRRPGAFLSVRFGNVLGSRGSALDAFRTQIAAGGPVTVTHPDVTRYFMTIHEAVQLVLQASVLGRDGEALVLDMGSPVRVTELVRHLAERAATPVKIVYTGLRDGEKLHETLFGDGERDRRPLHPLISHIPVPPLEPEEVRRLDPYARPAALVAALARLCRSAAPRRARPGRGRPVSEVLASPGAGDPRLGKVFVGSPPHGAAADPSNAAIVYVVHVWLRHGAGRGVDALCGLVGRPRVVRAARFTLHRSRRDLPNHPRYNGERALQGWLLSTIPPAAPLTVLDVGAHVGRTCTPSSRPPTPTSGWSRACRRPRGHTGWPSPTGRVS
jgi:nucleoside-diphosphate-sugar epimerase